MDPILLVHAAATLFMVGLIWFVQVVHYPLFAGAGRAGFAAYAADHQRLTGLVVAPPMLIEAACAAWLALAPPPGLRPPGAWLGFGLLAAIWLSTAVFQIPQHRRLSGGFDPAAHARLVRTNWLRTVGWSARGVLALYWLGAAAGS